VIYGAFAALGVILATLAGRRLAPDDATPPEVARRVRIAAIAGAVLGAYLFELPADLLGWAPPIDAHRFVGGRTVLGGLLGGWGAVELEKLRLGHRAPTGDRFALPLALGLGVGRVGCVFAGCCPGRAIDASSLLATLDLRLHGVARFPAALTEAYFHGLAALVLLVAMRRGVGATVRLPAYFAAYGAFRFAIELVREVPRPFFSLSYYQLLALLLFALSSRLAWRRWRGAPDPRAPRLVQLETGT
jgi:prolipoprotein diacylglyceryltransferase